MTSADSNGNDLISARSSGQEKLEWVKVGVGRLEKWYLMEAEDTEGGVKQNVPGEDPPNMPGSPTAGHS